MERSYKYYDIVMAFFITVLLVSNVASSAKIVDLKLSLFGFGLAFDAGTILFPLSYIFGDILTEVYGFKRSRRVIWMGFFALALSAGVFWLVGALPGEATWQTYAGDAAYAAILGGMSSGGIVLGSLAGYLTGEFSNSVVLARMKVWTSGRHLWMRTIGSTLIGQMVDTLAFMLVATLLGVFPWSLFAMLTVTNYLFKVAIEALMTPVTYGLVNFLKKSENEDVYDKETRFSLI
ncbi:MAG: transporter [Chloroflexi bacterium HGW-Chloroflexi-6]|nr:MAG: transporter [Chloroflexi bacterium HGW-Chloroflexi-6]